MIHIVSRGISLSRVGVWTYSKTIWLEMLFTIHAICPLESLTSLWISSYPHPTQEDIYPVYVLDDKTSMRFHDPPFQECLCISWYLGMRVCVLTLCFTSSCGLIHDPHCLQGYISEGWKIISSQSRESNTGLHLHPLEIIKKWIVNWSRIFFTSGFVWLSSWSTQS